MAQQQFQNLKYCHQRDKDIVNGYIKDVQCILPYEENSFFIIDKLVQNLILLYFHQILNSKILTGEEEAKLLQLLEHHTNNEFKTLLMQKSFNLIHTASRDTANSTQFINNVYDKQNVIILVHTKNNNVVGAYTAKGWSKSLKHAHGSIDNDVFIFGIRSNRGYEPQLSYIKHNSGRETIRHVDKSWIFLFGNEKGMVIFGLNSRKTACTYRQSLRFGFIERDYLFGIDRDPAEVPMKHLEVFEMI